MKKFATQKRYKLLFAIVLVLVFCCAGLALLAPKQAQPQPFCTALGTPITATQEENTPPIENVGYVGEEGCNYFISKEGDYEYKVTLYMTEYSLMHLYDIEDVRVGNVKLPANYLLDVWINEYYYNYNGPTQLQNVLYDDYFTYHWELYDEIYDNKQQNRMARFRVVYDGIKSPGKGAGSYNLKNASNYSVTIYSATFPTIAANIEEHLFNLTLTGGKKDGIFAKNCHYGDKVEIPIDHIEQRSSITGQYDYIDREHDITVSTGSFGRKDGSYLSSWTGTGLTRKSDYCYEFTFGASDATITAQWTELNYLVEYYYNGHTSNNRLRYGDQYRFPNVAYKVGHSAVWLEGFIERFNGGTFYGDLRGGCTTITLIETPHTYRLVWYTKGGTTESNLLDTSFTTVSYGKNYPVPKDPTRKGYRFAGWTINIDEYSASRPSLKYGDEFKCEVNASNYSTISLYAQWEATLEINLQFWSDEHIEDYGVAVSLPEGGMPYVRDAAGTYITKQDYVNRWNFQGENFTHTNIATGSIFTFSNITCKTENGRIFDDLVLTKLDDATNQWIPTARGTEYAVSKVGENYALSLMIQPEKSMTLRIELYSCIEVNIIAVDNYDSTNYEQSSKAGKVAGKVNAGDALEYSESVTIKLRNPAQLYLSRDDNLNAGTYKFLGWFTSLDEVTYNSTGFAQEVKGWTTPTIESSTTYYAVYHYIKVTVVVKSFSSEYNFENSSTTEPAADVFGGFASCSWIGGTSEIDTTTTGQQTMSVPNGVQYTLEQGSESSGYKFIGFYTSWANLCDDTDNNSGVAKNQTETVTSENITVTYYAKYVKTYNFTVSAPAGMGITRMVFPDNEEVILSGNKSASRTVQYWYNQPIGGFRFTYDENLYEFENVNEKWKITKSPAGFEVGNNILENDTISQGALLMPAGDVTFETNTIAKFVTVTIHMLRSNGLLDGDFWPTSEREVGSIDVALNADIKNKVYDPYAGTLSVQVRFNTNQFNFSAQPNTDVEQLGMKYECGGLYKKYDARDENGIYHELSVLDPINLNNFALDSAEINKDENGKLYADIYCAFIPKFKVKVVVDEPTRVDYVDFNNAGFTGQSGQKSYEQWFYYDDDVNFFVLMKSGEVKDYTVDPAWLTVNVTNANKTAYGFTMITSQVTFSITTTPAEAYPVSLNVFFVNDFQGFQADEEGFEDCGYITIAGTSLGRIVKHTHDLELGNTITLEAEANPNYTFVGWYHFNIQNSYAQFMREGRANYNTPLTDWFNTDVYELLTTETTLEDVRSVANVYGKNSYLAVFVKNLTLQLGMGDNGISNFQYQEIKEDQNAQSNPQSIEGNNQTFSVPLGTKFAVWATADTANGYDFSHYEIVSGVQSLAGYTISAGEIKADDLDLGTSDLPPYYLTFYLYDPVQIIAHTNVQGFNLNVKLVTEDLDGTEIQSCDGGTFEGLASGAVTGTVNVMLGAELNGFVKANTGFMFKSLSVTIENVNYETQQSLYMQKAFEGAELKIVFARNAYNIDIKTIVDGDKASSNDAGAESVIVRSAATDKIRNNLVYGDSANIEIVAQIGYKLFKIIKTGGNLEQDLCKGTNPILTETTGKQNEKENEDGKFCYYYTTPAIQVPNNPNDNAFEFTLIFKLQKYDLEIEKTLTDANTGKYIKTSNKTGVTADSNNPNKAIDINFSITDCTRSDDVTTTNVAEERIQTGYYNQIYKFDLNGEKSELRYYKSFVLSMTSFADGGAPTNQVFYSDEACTVQINNLTLTEGFGCIPTFSAFYLKMPLKNVKITLTAEYHEMNIVFDAKTNDGVFKNDNYANIATGIPQNTVTGTVFYNYNNYAVTDSTVLSNESNVAVLKSIGIPYPTKAGFKIVSYNSRSDGTGEKLIEFDYNAKDELTSVTINDFKLSSQPLDMAEQITVYAIYEYQNIVFTLDSKSTLLDYTGELRLAFETNINNYNKDIPYIFEWYDNNRNIPIATARYYPERSDCEIAYQGAAYFSDNGSDYVRCTYDDTQNKLVGQLYLRSVHHAGEYKCVVSIADQGTKYSAEDTNTIGFNKRKLDVMLDKNTTYYEAAEFEIDTTQVSNLISIHNITGVMRMYRPGLYSDANHPDLSITITKSIRNNAGIQIAEQYSEDGQPITGNYVPKFINTCLVEAVGSKIQVKAGVHLRTLNQYNLTENILLPEQHADPYLNIMSMGYAHFIPTSQARIGGYMVSYIIDEDDFGEYLTLQYGYKPGYSLYDVRINGSSVDYEHNSNNKILTFRLDASYIVDGVVEIKLIVTNACLVTVHYNSPLAVDTQMVQIVGAPFNAPSVQGIIPPGFKLDTWYNDAACTNPVSETWDAYGEQDIYAKWILSDNIDELIELTILDAGVDVTQASLVQNKQYHLERAYNSKIISINIGNKIPNISVSCVWKRKNFDGNVWYSVGTDTAYYVQDVSQKGIYSPYITVVDNITNNVKTFAADTIVVEIDLTPKTVNLTTGFFDKIYDGKKNISKTVSVQLVVGEPEIELTVTGQYSDENVSLDANNQPQAISVDNVKLSSHVQDMKNFKLPDGEQYFGVISPLDVEISGDNYGKFYDGAIFSQTITHIPSTLTTRISIVIQTKQSSQNQHLNGINAGIYSGDGVVCTIAGENPQNYNLNYSGITITIRKASINLIMDNKTVIYDGLMHSITATVAGGGDASLAEGIIQINYTYNGDPAEGKTNVGSYDVEATAVCDDNHTCEAQTARLTINKAQFYFKFLMNNTIISDNLKLQYDGQNHIGEISVVPVFANSEQITPEQTARLTANLNQQISFSYKQTELDEEVAVTQVIEVGKYKVNAQYDELNFVIITGNLTYAEFSIVPKTYSYSNLLKSATIPFTYNTQDHKGAVVGLAINEENQAEFLDKFTFALGTIQREVNSSIYSVTDAIIDANRYRVSVIITSQDPTRYLIQSDTNQVATYTQYVNVTVNKFVITASTDLIVEKIEKTYDGKTALPQNLSADKNARIKVVLRAQTQDQPAIEKIEEIVGDFVSANAGQNVAISNFDFKNNTNFEFESGAVKQAKTQTLFGNILTKDLRIDVGNGVIQDFYDENDEDATDYVYEITRANTNQFASGLLGGQWIQGDITCFATIYKATTYSMSLINEGAVAFFDIATAKIYDANYNEISWGNYSLSVYGNITLLPVAYKEVSVQIVTTGLRGIDNLPFDNIYNGQAKQIYAKLNNILCYYYVDGTDQYFKPMDSSYLDYRVWMTDFDHLDLQSVGIKQLELQIEDNIAGENYVFVDGEEGSEKLTTVEYSILQYIIALDVTTQMEYSSSLPTLTINNLPASHNQHSATATVTFNDVSSFAVGAYSFDNFVDEVELSVTTNLGQNVSANYGYTLAGTLTIFAKTITAPTNISASRVFTDANLKDDFDLVVASSLSVFELDASLYNILYYSNAIQTEILKSVGTYEVVMKLNSSNYTFLQQGQNIDTQTIGQMSITKAELGVAMLVQGNVSAITYDAHMHNDIFSAAFTFNGQPVQNVDYSLLITRNGAQSGVYHVGVYTAVINRNTFNHESFVLPTTLPTASVEVERYTFYVPEPELDEVWYTYYYAQPIASTFNHAFASPIEDLMFFIQFVPAQPVHAVGKYALQFAPNEQNDFMAAYPNYQLADLTTQFNVLEVTPRNHQDPNLLLRIEPITKEYDGSSYSAFTLIKSDLGTKFHVLYSYGENAGQPFDASLFDITSITLQVRHSATGQPVNAKNVGDYVLDVQSIVCSTHLSTQFIVQNANLTITPKLLVLTDVDGVTKTYDATKDVIFAADPLANIEDADEKNNLSVVGIYDNANVGTNKMVTLQLQGNGAQNYTLVAGVYTQVLEQPIGTITPKELIIASTHPLGWFEKEYDATTAYNSLTGYTLTGLCGFDDVGLVGTFDNKNVAQNKQITFVISNNNYQLQTSVFLTGTITPKELRFANKEGNYSKPQDGTSTILNLQLSDLVGICENDNLQIVSAVYVDTQSLLAIASVGTHKMLVTLGGADKDNYSIEDRTANILDRIITLIYNYQGDVPFVNDGKVIQGQTLSSQNLVYGYPICYLQNAPYNQLVQPWRVGYNFDGWFAEDASHNTIELDDNTSTGIFDFETLKANNYEVEIKARWSKQIFQLSFVVMTEDAGGGAFVESRLGGDCFVDLQPEMIDDLDEVNSVDSLLCEYFSHHTIYIKTNQGFELYDTSTSDDSIQELAFSTEGFNVHDNTKFTIWFSRQSYTLNIDLKNFDVYGFSTPWQRSNGMLTLTQKYGSIQTLPNLTAVGYDFLGYFEPQTTITHTPGATFTFVHNANFEVQFSPQTYFIVVDANGGIFDPTFVFDNPLTHSIAVTYNALFDNLPPVTKKGYDFDGYTLLSNSIVVQTGINNLSRLNFAGEHMTLLANWEKINNKIAASLFFDDTDFETYGIDKDEHFAYSSPFRMQYKLTTWAHYENLNENGFSALTESVVILNAQNLSSVAYKFVGWSVEGTILSVVGDVDDYDGALFEVIAGENGAYLKITNFAWGENVPDIKLVYAAQKQQIEVLGVDATRGQAVFESGTFEENNQIFTLTRAKVVIATSSNAGYHLAESSVRCLGADAVLDANKKITITNIAQAIQVSLQFDKDDFVFDISVPVLQQAVVYAKYAINQTVQFANFEAPTPLKTEDILNLSLCIKTGYTLQVTTSDNQVAVVLDLTSQTQTSIIYNYVITGFTQDFVITLDIGKISYSVSASQKLRDISSNEFVDIDNLQFVKVANDAGDEISTIEFQEYVNFTADVVPTERATNFGTTLSVEYVFDGWYSETPSGKLRLTSLKTLRLPVTSDLQVVAVFVKFEFVINFACNGAQGLILNGDNALVSNSERVVAGGAMQGVYRAVPAMGYQFKQWTVTKTYNTATSAIMANALAETETLTQATLPNFSPIYAHYLFSAEFDKIDISVDMSTVRVDGNAVTDTTTLICENQSQQQSTIQTQTHTTLKFNAVASLGYEFVGWEIQGAESSEYRVVSYSSFTTYKQQDTEPLPEDTPSEENLPIQPENVGAADTPEDGVVPEEQWEEENPEQPQDAAGAVIDYVTNTLEIQFVSSTTTHFVVVAKFDVATFAVAVKFNNLNNVNFPSGSIVSESNQNLGNSATFAVKCETQLQFTLNVFKGFMFAQEDNAYKIGADQAGVTYSVQDQTDMMTIDDQRMFSSRYLITVSGYMANTNLIMWADSQSTQLHFAKLDDFNENTYQKDAFMGSIKYYTNNLVVEENQTLTPREPNCVFIGWSTTKSAENIIINEYGELIISLWARLETDVDLYPLYRAVNIAVEVAALPMQSLVDADNLLEDVFANLTAAHTVNNNQYIFQVGTNFGLSIPQFKTGYYFYSFEYYAVGEDNNIEVVSIMADGNQNLNADDLFKLTSEALFNYSWANNYPNFVELQDGVMYINIRCSVDVRCSAENAFTENAVSVIGGTAILQSQDPNEELVDTNLIPYGKEVNIIALPDDGYQVKEWRTNGQILDVTSSTLAFVVEEPVDFVVVFMGKPVLVTFALSQDAKSATLTKGNTQTVANGYICHVGDMIEVFAQPNVGYNFENKWKTSNGAEFFGKEYTISVKDGQVGQVALSPQFVERNLQVYFKLQNQLGSVLVNGKKLSEIRGADGEKAYMCSIPYFSSLVAEITPSQKHKVTEIILDAEGRVSSVLANYSNRLLLLTPGMYNNASELNITVQIQKLYWQDVVQEENLLAGQTGMIIADLFEGNGTQAVPYRINSVNDLILLAYVVNNGILQDPELEKNNYNSAITFYEITGAIELSARYWTPIGTSTNPFDSTISIYNMPKNIKNDLVDDPYASSSLFDLQVLKEYGGLFGFLGENANILLKIKDYMLLYILIGSVTAASIITLIILLIMRKIRRERIERFDETNKYLFDSD